MNKVLSPLPLICLLLTAGVTTFSYADGGGSPDRILCDTTSSDLHIEVCADSFTLNGVTYKEGGIHTQVFTNAGGCDSTVYLFLTLKANKPLLAAIDREILSVTEPYETYQWYKNDIAIAGADGSIHKLVPPLPGYYYVVVNAAFCPDTSNYYIIPEGGGGDMGVEEQNQPQPISVYPNPTSGSLTLSSPVPVRAEIYAMDGRRWLRNNDAQKLSLKNLPSGIYFIRITGMDGQLIKVERIVKK